MRFIRALVHGYDYTPVSFSAEEIYAVRLHVKKTRMPRKNIATVQVQRFNRHLQCVNKFRPTVQR